ncbi:MAG TPA: hypothetical protein VMT68_11115 [Caulobacteraceae bacterium]|nr:hypothetical protein [Caulobacteraceae bacterium]
MSDIAIEKVRHGAWVQPVNRWQAGENSIHNDEVARSVGMRGGTIPGTVHLSHFRPLLDELFGDRWLINGAISMYYTYATTHLEDVRAVIKAPSGRCWDLDAIFPAWVETPEGKTVCKGTVSIGAPASPSYIRGLPLESAPAGENRIAAGVRPGTELKRVEGFVVEHGEDGIVRDPQAMYGALASNFLRGQIAQPAVGFFGATEVALRNGPIRVGTPYVKTGRVVCVGVTDKTEYVWVDSELTDASGRLIAEMRHMTRWMKSSSPLWKT